MREWNGLKGLKKWGAAFLLQISKSYRWAGCTLLFLCSTLRAGAIEEYFDFGSSFGTYVWPFIEYPAPNYTGILNKEKMNGYLSSLFDQMKQAGQETLFLSFAQLENIEAYTSGDFTQPGTDRAYDVVMALLASFQEHSIAVPGNRDFLSYLIDRAHASGMQVILAFGGASARDESFRVLQEGTDTYAQKATDLMRFVRKYDLDGIDLDVESTTAISSQGKDSLGKPFSSFLRKVHNKLAKLGKTVSLTTQLGHDWRKVFAPFLGQKFSLFFDQLNLMAYSNTQYWLDPNTPPGKPDQGWTIEQWIDAVGIENSGNIHVGFDDGVHYENPQANGGQYSFQIRPGSSNGSAAGQIYRQLMQQLNADGYTTPLGTPFFWPDQGVSPHGQSRYAPTASGKSNFISQMMIDFYEEIGTNDSLGSLPSSQK